MVNRERTSKSGLKVSIEPPELMAGQANDIIPAFLRDRATDFWDELPIKTQNDLDLLKESFTNHYMPKETRRLFSSDLYTRKQRENESPNDFGREIQQLVRKAYADMPVNHQDTLMREHFINGLPPFFATFSFVRRSEKV